MNIFATSEISHEKIWTWLRKWNLKRETESLLIPAQNNAIRTNYVKSKIDKIQQKSKCALCGDRDKTINHVISESSKLAQKYQSVESNPLGVVQKLKFDHTNK